MTDIVLNSGDTAWMLASTALVLLMTPGLAFFYGGMVRTKSVLNMMMMSFITIGIVSVLWVIYGFELAFGYKAESPWYGNLSFSGLGGMVNDLTNNGGIYPIPVLVFAAFQLTERQAYTTSIWLDDSDCCRGKSFEEKYQGNINRCCGE